MKKALLLLASAALLFAGCQKEQIAGTDGNGETVQVTVTAGLDGTATKAAADLDGNAAKVNHWVFEVLDAGGKIFYREVRTPEAGTLTQTYNVSLIKNQNYELLFWADSAGVYYNTENLQEVSLKTPATYKANLDSRDAFSAHKSITANGTPVSVELKRPFAQINVITTDLAALWEQAAKSAKQDSVYAANKPVDFVAKIKVPTTFDVLNQSCGLPSEEDVIMMADSCYVAYKADKKTPKDSTNYLLHLNPATLYMDYVFASAGENDVIDINFSFKSNSKEISYDFTSIPVQANYRTNIKGKLLSNDTEITVTIVPTWLNPEKDVDYPQEEQGQD